jgi:hypothetical protein
MSGTKPGSLQIGGIPTMRLPRSSGQRDALPLCYGTRRLKEEIERQRTGRRRTSLIERGSNATR